MIQSDPSLDEQELKGELQREYLMRFGPIGQFRNAVWVVLTTAFFQKLIPPDSTVLDLGCGWGEFINHIRAGTKYGMDLNPEGHQRLAGDVEFLNQDCSKPWALPDSSLDCVFTSNFFEHLRTKDDLRRTVQEAHRCLKPGGQLICMGPNVRYLAGEYWDFWDHYLPLTERSLAELLELSNFRVERCLPKFLPYKMVRRRPLPIALVRLYLRFPPAWWLLGKQFLVIAGATKDHS